jgi:hypothetical protein
MLLNAEILKHPFFSKEKPLNLTCSTCHQGRLHPRDNKYWKEKTASTKAWEKEEHYDGSGYEARVCYLLICSNRRCAEPYIVVGSEFEDYDYVYDARSGTEEQVEIIVFRPLFFNPPLLFFTLHPIIPKRISEELLKSFNLFFADISAAANKVRVALEILMDELGIDSVNHKGNALYLDARLKIYEKQNAIIGEQLLSIKLVGNSGSHPHDLDRSDVVTAYEIVEHVLDELYVLEHRRMESLAKAKSLTSKSGNLKSSTSPKQSTISPPNPSAI